MTTNNERYFHLTNMFLEEEGMVLHSNHPDSRAHLKGAAFMSADKADSGTHWKMIRIDDNYFHLTTRLLEEQGYVLEGNRLMPNASRQGASFMVKNRASGTAWRKIAIDDDYFQLTTHYLEQEGHVLEGNRVAPDSFLDGNAFMARSGGVTGTFWRTVPVHVNGAERSGAFESAQKGGGMTLAAYIASLMNLLLQIDDLLRPDTRGDIISELPNSIEADIERHAAARRDLINTIKICAKVDNGLMQLIAAIRNNVGETQHVKQVEEFMRRTTLPRA